ncbi:MAG TPA: ATP-binding protein, partial [Burkholderiales bacterium]|nr:ATP-binding protein [Burkholderiales bacterium]
NDRLEQQALNLQKSEALLKSKQEELRAANEQLQEKARQLSEQMHQVEFKNREIEQARSALEDKAEQLSLSSRYKSEFLANMSHELRTPLNSLLILARLLADNVGGNLTPKQVEFARTIHSSGAELLALINDILDLAKIESGTVTLNIAEERFSELADYVERTFRQMATDKALEFRVELDAALPAALETDGKRLQQIVTNLLSNAFKFTSRGSVTLKVEPAASGWSAAHPALSQADRVIAFSVRDTGIGIPASKQRLIFEAFQQADGTTSREYGGTGLGLSISRELARLLGGEIRVQSAPGEGSTFTLYLPLEYQPLGQPGGEVRVYPLAEASPPPEPAPEIPVEKAPGEPALAGRRVLVVDDDIRNVFALTSALEAHGLRVVHAESGKEAIELLERANDVDVVLMDVMMPGLDGLDTMRIIRGLEGYQSLPIVAVTAKAMIGDREKCLEAGANDYVAKPVNVELLLGTLARLLAPVDG